MLAQPRQIDVLIVGAGVDGLAASYALRQSERFQQGKWKVRILERREQFDTTGSRDNPLHLSKDGREALSSFLAPSDASTLLEARRSIPAAHDGITISSCDDREKKVFWTVKGVGSNPMVERSDLKRVLKNGAGEEIQWGTEVIALKESEGGVQVIVLKDGVKESITADVVIGADGMFSTTRDVLYSSELSATASLSASKRMFHMLPQTLINLRTTSESMREWINDHNGLNLIYGESFFATMLPLSYPSMYVALAIPSKWLAPGSQGVIAKDKRKPGSHGEELLRQLEDDPGWKDREVFPLWTAKETLGGKGRVVLVGNAAHGMPPFHEGAGTSSAMRDIVELARVLTTAEAAGDGEQTRPSWNAGNLG
ncbi:hypothetical protein IAR50_004973 [Cryptococcus sp. DSM 104548]